MRFVGEPVAAIVAETACIDWLDMPFGHGRVWPAINDAMLGQA